MADPDNGTPRYQVHCSGAINQAIRAVHRLASRQGRGRAVTNAFRQIVHNLSIDPFQVGEPAYHLPSLRMQVRTTIVRPLVVDFAICEDRPLVFIKGVKLLSERGS
jgi:hypothetical protein